MRKKVWYLIAGAMAVAALVAVVVSAPVNRGAAQSSGSPAACPSPMASPEASPMASPAASPVACASPVAGGGVTIEMVDIAFKPKEFSIAANTPVKVTLKNTGALPHDFTIDKLKISMLVDPGKTGEVTINAPAGTYEFYCNQPGHKAAGMVGTLTVK